MAGEAPARTHIDQIQPVSQVNPVPSAARAYVIATKVPALRSNAYLFRPVTPSPSPALRLPPATGSARRRVCNLAQRLYRIRL